MKIYIVTANVKLKSLRIKQRKWPKEYNKKAKGLWGEGS